MKAWLGLTLAICIFCTASAQTPSCASDETADATGTCICKSGVYAPEGSPRQPAVQCLSDQMKLNMSKCQLEASRFDWANLHLLDSSCVGTRVVEDIALMVVSTRTSSNVCGNIITLSAGSSSVTYSNNLTIPGKVFSNGIVERQNYTFNFSCSYPLNNIPVSLLTAIHPILGIVGVNLPTGNGVVTVLMAAYTDASFSNVYGQSSATLNVQDSLYVSVKAPDLNGDDFSLKVTRLYATGTSNSNADVQYSLITEGCRDPQWGDLVSINHNGESTEAQFTVTVFQVSGSDSVYFHAAVEICQGTCTPSCGAGSRIGRTSGESSLVSAGPFYTEKTDLFSGSSDRFTWIWTVNFLMVSLLVQILHK